MNMNEQQLTTRYLEAVEEKQDLNNLIINLIKKCHDLLTLNTNSITHRRKAILNVFIYEQHIISGHVKDALEILNPLINLFIKEKWIDNVIPLLKKKLNCCLLLGLPYDYLVSTICLFTLGGRGKLSGQYDGSLTDKQYLSDDELGFLSKEILILLQSNEPYDPWGISVPSRPPRTPESRPSSPNTKTSKSSAKTVYNNTRMNDINIEPPGNYICINI
jgi:hypothetical protein